MRNHFPTQTPQCSGCKKNENCTNTRPLPDANQKPKCYEAAISFVRHCAGDGYRRGVNHLNGTK